MARKVQEPPVAGPWVRKQLLARMALMAQDQLLGLNQQCCSCACAMSTPTLDLRTSGAQDFDVKSELAAALGKMKGTRPASPSAVLTRLLAAVVLTTAFNIDLAACSMQSRNDKQAATSNSNPGFRQTCSDNPKLSHHTSNCAGVQEDT